MATDKQEQADESDDLFQLSQESDFYGDEATKKAYEERAANFDVVSWWRNKKPSLTEIANRNLATQKKVKAVKLYNIYEGNLAGRQLTETLAEFLQRLPPRTTEGSASVPWIYIANPYVPRKSGEDSKQQEEEKDEEEGEEELSNEGPPEEGENMPKFITVGNELLEKFESKRKEIESEMKGKNAPTISRAVNKHRDETVKEIRKAAVELKCTTGKWLLFIPPGSVNEVWECVARETMKNELGISAKVAPFQLERRRQDRVICIYTRDFEDKDDVGRVVKKMRDLGLVDNRSRPIYYKCDAYTYLDIKSDNLHGIKPSLYSSAEFIQPKNKKSSSSSKRKLGDIMD